MINIFKSKKEKEEFISEFKNPFKYKNIERVDFTIEKALSIRNKTDYYSTIWFKENNTSCRHQINAKNFKELILKTEYFIESL